MAASPTSSYTYYSTNHKLSLNPSPRSLTIVSQHQQQQPQQTKSTNQVTRREVILRSSEIAVLGAIFSFSGTKPKYLGVQKNTPALALCPATKIVFQLLRVSVIPSTMHHLVSAEMIIYAHAFHGQNSKAHAHMMIKSTKPDKFTPQIVEKKDDYLHVEYKSPILGFVDDVEFWFPPGKKSLVEYRSASRLGNFDFDVNRKRIKALRLALEKKGWASEDNF